MYRIMLADDEGIVIDSLKFIIEKNFAGMCEIASAKTGRSVIELAESFRPDIAFMDIQMPGINGIDAMRELKKGNLNTVFVVLSAYDKFDYAKEAINLGVLEYVNKPFDQKKIVSVLRKAMQVVDGEKLKRSKELEIKEKLETIVPIIENGLIQGILTHEHFKEDIDNYRTLLSINEEYGYMMVLVSGQEQVGNYMTGAVAASIRTQKEYMDIRLLIEDYFKGFTGSVMGNKLPLLLTCEKDRLTFDERTDIIGRAEKLAERLEEKFDFTFRIGIGSVKPFESLAESYSEAVMALIRSTESVAHADDVRPGCEYEENYPRNLELSLFENVKAGNINAAVAEANRFFDWMSDSYSGNLSDIRLKIIEFVLWAERLAYENGGHVYHFLSRTDYLPAVSQMQCLDEMRIWFVEHIGEAVKMIDSGQDEGSMSAVSQAKAYIDGNYMKELSLDDVSREVDISPYYFSKLFKNETGVNFIDYLTNIRIEKAKALILSGTMPMKEICGAVGYQDPNYFSRIFKKNTGKTPTEFKEQ